MCIVATEKGRNCLRYCDFPIRKYKFKSKICTFLPIDQLNSFFFENTEKK